MKNFRKLSLLLVFVLILGTFFGCQNNNVDDQSEVEQAEEQIEEKVDELEEEIDKLEDEADKIEDGAYTVEDMLDREVEFAAVPQRVVVINPSDAEIMYAIGEVDKIVGRGTYVDYPEEVMDLPVVASGSDMNAEEIIALEPDLVLMTDMAQSEEQVNTLVSAGINVIVTQASDIDGVYDAIEIIGEAMQTEEAEKVIEEMEAAFEEIEENNKDNEGKTIYFEVSPLEYGLWTAGDDTFMNEIAELLSLENIFEDVEGWGEISEEQVISRNPDYIVTISMGSTTHETPVLEILDRAGWEDVPAVKNEAVLNLVNNELSRPSPRLVEGARLLEEFINEN